MHCSLGIDSKGEKIGDPLWLLFFQGGSSGRSGGLVGGKVFGVALAGEMTGLPSCLLSDNARVSCSETVSSLTATSEKLKN